MKELRTEEDCEDVYLKALGKIRRRGELMSKQRERSTAASSQWCSAIGPSLRGLTAGVPGHLTAWGTKNTP